MKKLISTFSLGTMLAVMTVSGVVFASRFTTVPPPVQGTKALSLVLSADTVSGPSGFAGVADAAAQSCVQANLFLVGNIIVFRMWANDVKNGGYPVTPTTITKGYPIVTIPNSPKALQLPMSWVTEPKTPTVGEKQISYWEAFWKVPPGYPIGRINFTITAKTNKTSKIPALTGTYTQNGFSSSSQLQIVPPAE